MYIFVCFIRNSLRVIIQGFVDPIMQHGVRIEAVFASLQQGEHMVESTMQFPAYNPVIQTRIIILWTELFPKKKREKRSKERFFNLSSSTVVSPHFYKNYSVSTRNPAGFQSSRAILHTELILPQEILQLQDSSRAGSFQQLFPVSPSILHGRIRLPASLQHSRAIQHKQASSNSTR